MKQIFLKKEGNPNLLLFFAGWGADEKLFDYPICEGYDCLLCFDYRETTFDDTLLNGYTSIRLMAWAMGVWMAAYTLSGLALTYENRLAINGTLYPIHAEKGIPPAVFQGTLSRFSAVTLSKFRRRMCGTTEGVKQFLSHEPYRTLEELQEELACLEKRILESENFLFNWDKAIIGTNDYIFPASNQQNAWQDTPTMLLDIAHYDEKLFADCLAGKEDIWTKS